MSMRALRRISVLCFVFAATTAAPAAVTDFRVDTDATVPVNGPIPVGNEFTCTPIEDGSFDPISSYSWKIQYDYGMGCVSLWHGAGSNETLLDSSGVPVSLKIKLTVTYDSVFGDDPENPLPPHADTIIIKDIVITKADNVRVPADGADVATARDTMVTLGYEVRCGTHTCPLIGGTAQEKFTNRMFLGMPQIDIDWRPPSPSPTFRLSEGFIEDKHWIELTDVQWNGLANGDVIQTATQSLRIKWTDPCGIEHLDQVLGDVNLTQRKVSATEWKVETVEAAAP